MFFAFFSLFLLKGISSAIAFATVLRTNKSIDYFNMDRLILFTRQEEQTVHICEMLRVSCTSYCLFTSFYHLKWTDRNDS